MISVVLANYNGSAYLGQALDSIMGQTHEDFECVVVDDGSTDASPAIIQKYVQAYPDKVRALLECENCGQGAAFGKGVAAATGEIVAFMDSDDLWMPHKLERVQEMACRLPDAVLYCHNLYMHIDGVPTTKKFREVVVTGDVFGYVQRTGWFPLFVPTSGLAFPRSVLDEILPIPRSFRTCADGYLTRTSMALGRIAGTDECCGYYRRHAANSVLGNCTHNAMAYRETILLPALNDFYRRRRISFRFPLGPKWKRMIEGQARRIVHLLKS